MVGGEGSVESLDEIILVNRHLRFIVIIHFYICLKLLIIKSFKSHLTL